MAITLEADLLMGRAAERRARSMLWNVMKGAIGFALVACSTVTAYTQTTGAQCTLSKLTPIFTFRLKEAGTDYQLGYKLTSGTFSFKVFKGGPVEIKSGTNTLILALRDCVWITFDGDLHLSSKAPDTEVRVQVVR
jgi:hypothetical protein